MSEQQFLNRAVGLLVIEVVNSNPNGDPDQESDPRTRTDEYGEISSVSFKRKLRNLVMMKDGPVWQEMSKTLQSPERFEILESPQRNRREIAKMEIQDFLNTYWDARVFGTTFLEKNDKGGSAIRTGVVQFGLGVSVSKVEIERLTTTNQSGVQDEKTRGMAPLGYRVVRHGVYCMPFFVNPTAAIRTNCSKEDIELMCRLISYAYTHTSSYVRSDVRIRHAWYIEHQNSLGSCSDFMLLDAMKPVFKGERGTASTDWTDYQVPTDLPESLKTKVKGLRDLIP